MATTALLPSLAQPLQAGVVQEVRTVYEVPLSAIFVQDSDSVFRPSGNLIDQDIQAMINAPAYVVTAHAGRFGQIGMSMQNMGLGPGSSLRATVLVASDDFVNIHGGPAEVSSQFVIDGGFLQDFFSTNTTVHYELSVGATNVGSSPAESSGGFLAAAGSVAAGFGGVFGPGGGYSVSMTTDGSGNRSFSTSSLGGLDLGATFDPGSGLVEIPASLQTLDLGILGSGHRILIGYQVDITIEQNGVAEGLSAGFSDPFSLSGSPNPILAIGGIKVTPVVVPEPRQAMLWLAGLAMIACAQRARRRRVVTEVRACPDHSLVNGEGVFRARTLHYT